MLIAACGGAGWRGCPSQILAAARTAVDNAGSYEISGTGDFGSGIDRLDFKIVGADLNGTFGEGASTIDVIVLDGDVYLEAQAAYYTADGVSAAEAATLASTWVEATAGWRWPVTSPACQPSPTSRRSCRAPARSPRRERGGRAVRGHPRQSRRWHHPRGGDLGTAYPVQMRKTGSATTTFDLFNWNALTPFTAPPNPLTLPGD